MFEIYLAHLVKSILFGFSGGTSPHDEEFNIADPLGVMLYFEGYSRPREREIIS
jgi:hypothetical protein